MHLQRTSFSLRSTPADGPLHSLASLAIPLASPDPGRRAGQRESVEQNHTDIKSVRFHSISRVPAAPLRGRDTFQAGPGYVRWAERKNIFGRGNMNKGMETVSWEAMLQLGWSPGQHTLVLTVTRPLNHPSHSLEMTRSAVWCTGLTTFPLCEQTCIYIYISLKGGHAVRRSHCTA